MKRIQQNKIETERLRLRKPELSDLLFFTRLYGNAEVMNHIPPNGRPATVDEARDRLNCLVAHWEKHRYGMFVVCLKETAKPVGYCGLRSFENQIELGYIIDQPYWGIGIASEAARACVQYAVTVLNSERLISITHPDNAGSQKILTHLGFKREQENDGIYYGASHHFFGLDVSFVRSPLN